MVLTQVSTVFSLGARGRATTKRAIISGMDRSVYFSIAIPFFFFFKGHFADLFPPCIIYRYLLCKYLHVRLITVEQIMLQTANFEL